MQLKNWTIHGIKTHKTLNFKFSAQFLSVDDLLKEEKLRSSSRHDHHH